MPARQNLKKKNTRIDAIMAISIVCSIGFIPRKLFMAESKETKIL